MQSKYAAFAALRKLALQDFIEILPKIPRWSRSAARPFHHIASRTFYLSSRHYNDQLPFQAPLHESVKPQESVEPQESFEPQESDEDTKIRRQRSKVWRPPVPFDKQVYEITFTCKPCDTRSTHKVSKQGYHFGSVLITCPECKNKHIISDHLRIFIDKPATIEDLLREKGQLVKKGTLSEDGDLEFWADGTITSRSGEDDGQTRSQKGSLST